MGHKRASWPCQERPGGLVAARALVVVVVVVVEPAGSEKQAPPRPGGRGIYETVKG